jgi:hypothetical protein
VLPEKAILRLGGAFLGLEQQVAVQPPPKIGIRLNRDQDGLEVFRQGQQASNAVVTGQLWPRSRPQA